MAFAVSARQVLRAADGERMAASKRRAVTPSDVDNVLEKRSSAVDYSPSLRYSSLENRLLLEPVEYFKSPPRNAQD